MRRRLQTEKAYEGDQTKLLLFGNSSSEEVIPVHSVLKSEVQAGLELSCQYDTEKIARYAST